MRHRNVQSARAWLFAKSNAEIPLDAPNPQTPEEIHRKLAEARARCGKTTFCQVAGIAQGFVAG